MTTGATVLAVLAVAAVASVVRAELGRIANNRTSARRTTTKRTTGGQLGGGRAGSTVGLPWGTLVVNLVAAFAVGMLFGRMGEFATITRVGALGALSTWSTLALEIVDLFRHRQWLTAGGYLLVSVVGGIALAWLGLTLA